VDAPRSCGAWCATGGSQSRERVPGALSTYLKGSTAAFPHPCSKAHQGINGRFFYNDTLDGFNFESNAHCFTDVLDRLQRDLGKRRLPPCTPARVHSIYLPGFSTANNLGGLLGVGSVIESIWLGNRTCIAPHFDNTENIACVVAQTPLHHVSA